MSRESLKKLIKSSAVALAAAALSTAALVRPVSFAEAAAGPQRRATARRAAPRRAPQFSHSIPKHRQACVTCHKFPSANWNEVRQGGDAFPDVTQYPEHASCLGCHRRQFFTSERPFPSICAVCHQSATPRDIKVHPFPTVVEAFDKSVKGAAADRDFDIFFPHDKHLALLGGLRREVEGAGGVKFVRASHARRPMRQEDAAKANAVCANCHQTYMPQGESEDEFVTKPPKDLAEDAFWLKKGTFKTSPRGHSACFTCHTADAGISPAPSDCATCHRLPPGGQAAAPDFDAQAAARMGVSDRLTLLLWRGRQSARFRHEWFSHAEMKCADCHKVEEMNTADARTTAVPVVSCGGGGSGCHITTTDDEGGVLNLAVAQKQANPSFTCTKCHVVLGARPVPASHASALSAIKK